MPILEQQITNMEIAKSDVLNHIMCGIQFAVLEKTKLIIYTNIGASIKNNSFIHLKMFIPILVAKNL